MPNCTPHGGTATDDSQIASGKLTGSAITAGAVVARIDDVRQGFYRVTVGTSSENSTQASNMELWIADKKLGTLSSYDGELEAFCKIMDRSSVQVRVGATADTGSSVVYHADNLTITPWERGKDRPE